MYIELVEIIYFFEIIMNFLTERRNQDTGAPVYSLKDIALMYVIKEKTFGVHLLTAFPYQLLTTFMVEDNPEEQWLRNILMFRLLRLFRISNNFIPVDVVLSCWKYFFKVDERDEQIKNERWIINLIKIMQ